MARKHTPQSRGVLAAHSEWNPGVAKSTDLTANLLEVGGNDSPDPTHAATRLRPVRDWPGTISRPSGIR